MAKTTRREELLSMFDEQAAEDRCTIVIGLKHKAEELTAKNDTTIKALDEEERIVGEDIQALRDEAGAISLRRKIIVDDKVKLLRANKLYSFSKQTCGSDEIHPDLVTFDKETRGKREELIMKKLPR